MCFFDSPLIYLISIEDTIIATHFIVIIFANDVFLTNTFFLIFLEYCICIRRIRDWNNETPLLAKGGEDQSEAQIRGGSKRDQGWFCQNEEKPPRLSGTPP